MTEPKEARRPEIRAITTWVIGEALTGTPFEPLLDGMCQQLVKAGVPLWRGNFSMRAHHPEIGAFAYRWKRDQGMVHEEYSRAQTMRDTGWEHSPLKALVEGNSMELRHRLRGQDEPFPFPMFYELKEQGATDYFATQELLVDDNTWAPSEESRHRIGLIVSWTSDAPDGFSERDLADIRFLMPPLALALKSNSNHKMAQDLLGVYLGADAGRRVLSGEITRGSLETIRTAILYFDLQGFTRLSETLEPEAMIALLNDYFGAVVAAVHARGGNVLKFMGDGLLAIFPEMGVGQSGLAAIDAVSDIRVAMAEVTAARQADDLTSTGFSAALHAGEVLYGNIGAPDRLDFTVIGPAVNAAARIQGMCAGLGQDILISSNVAKPALDLRPALVSVGVYRLRSVADRVELYTLD